MLHLIGQGFILGWSVAWPPGPINAEMLRRGIQGHFQSAVAVGGGACLGDFIWALVVVSGVGWLAQMAWFRFGLILLSGSLLGWLGIKYLRRAWLDSLQIKSGTETTVPAAFRKKDGFLLGMGLALSSPWNISFWIAVIGQRTATEVSTLTAFILACAVLSGAFAWTLDYSAAIHFGARFTNRWWQVWTQAITGCLMFYFLFRLIMKAVGD